MTDFSEMDAADLYTAAEKQLTSIIDGLDDLDLIGKELTDRDTIAALLVDIDDMKRSIDFLFKSYKAALLSEAGERAFEVPNLGRFEIVKKKKRTGWKHDLLVPLVVQAGQRERRIIDPDNGEVEDEGYAVARALRDCFSFGAGKVGGLRHRGLDPADFCNEEDDGYDVRLPAARPEGRVA